MALKIKRTGSSEYTRHIKAIVFGEPGAGKTLMSSTFPNPFYVVADPGLMSIADRNIPFVEVEDTSDILGIKALLDQDAASREEMLGFPVDTVVIDTIDEVQRILIQERLKSEKKTAMTLPDWGWLSEQMQGIVRGFRNLDMNVVFTCHLKEVTDGDTGRVYQKPGMQGGIADQLPGFVDLSMAIVSSLETVIEDNETKKIQRRILHTFPTPQMGFLKDRSGKLPDTLEINFDDDYQRLYDLIYAESSDLPDGEVSEVASKVQPSMPSEDTNPVPQPQAAAGTSEAPAETVVPQGGFTYVTADGTEVVSLNELPAGVVPIPGGHNVNFYCEETGHELDSTDQADISHIRFRRILSRDAMDKLKR